MSGITTRANFVSYTALTSRKHLRFILTISTAIALVVAAVIFFAAGIGKPYLGINLTLTPSGWIVESVDSGGVASQVGIEQGDKAVTINGQPADTVLQQYRQSGTVLGPFFHELAVTDAAGNVKTVHVDAGYLSGQTLVQQLALAAISAIMWAVGFYVFYRKPENMAAVLLCLFGALAGLSFGASLAGAVGVPAAVILQIVSSIIAPWLLVRFMIVLPEENALSRRKLFSYIAYLPPLITLLMFPLLGWKDGQPVQWFRTLRFFEYAAGFFVAVFFAVFNYFHSHSIRTKQQMRIVLLSTLVALIPIVILILIPYAISRETVVPPGASILFAGFIPIGLGYAVVVERLMDVDVYIRRSIIYGAITVVMTAILSLAVFVPLAFRGTFGTGTQLLLALAAGFLATMLFGPTKKWAEIGVDRILYKDRYDYRQIIDAISNSLKLLKDTVEISRVVVGTVVRTLNLSGACLYVKTQSGDFNVGACQGSLAVDEIQDKLAELTDHSGILTEFPNPAASDGTHLKYVIPLFAGDQKVGVLFLSHKASRQEFSSDDTYLLQGIASVASFALHSAMLIRDVSVRDTFVSIASHELRTPLTAVIGYSDLLLRRDPPEATRKQWLRTVLDNGTRIAEMVDDLLDVSRIRSGKIALKIEKTQVSPIISEQVITAGSATTKHNFVLDVVPDLNEVYVDRNKFNQIMANLLNNAVKYSPKGGRITVTARNENAQSRVIVSVTDEGIGISPEDKETLFQTFHRIQRPETVTIRGIGLGLYIVKEWTEAMGGKVWFDSELNKGTTFYLALPTRPVEKGGHAG